MKKRLLCNLVLIKCSWTDHVFCSFNLSKLLLAFVLSLGLVFGIKANLQDQYSHWKFALKMNEMKVLFVEENHVLFIQGGKKAYNSSPGKDTLYWFMSVAGEYHNRYILPGIKHILHTNLNHIQLVFYRTAVNYAFHV